jgi:PPM family protein phosphatase
MYGWLLNRPTASTVTQHSVSFHSADAGSGRRLRRVPHLTTAFRTTIGRRYDANYDVAHLTEAPLLAVVADGMGDGEGSARAGRTAVDTFVELAGDGPTGIRAAVAAAQRRVGAIGREVGGLAGCTLTALVETPSGFWITQIGDSRVYRLRGTLLELLTVDHTSAWLGAVHGWYPFDSPQAAAARYQLTRYIGHTGEPEPDVLHVDPRPGDVFLLCTDGIAEQVRYQRVQQILTPRTDPGAMADQLVAAADEAGGRDNATAIVVVVS